MLQALWFHDDQRTLVDWPRHKERWLQGEGLIWIDVQAPTPEEMEELGRDFGLSPFVVRACLHPEHRAKLKDFRTHFLLVLNAVGRGISESGDPTDIERWRAHELNLVAGDRFVLTVHPGTVTAMSQVFGRYTKEREARPQVDGLVFVIADAVTAGYNLVLDRLDKQIDEVETMIFSGVTDHKVVDRLLGLKRHVLYLRRLLGPQRDALGTMMRRDLPNIPPEGRVFAIDLYEHTLRIFDLLDTYRDLITSALDAYRTTVSNRTNEIMKTLTIVSTIMLPLTLISGIFGMNFSWIPLTGSWWGFLLITGFMLSIGLVMTVYFRRRGWF